MGSKDRLLWRPGDEVDVPPAGDVVIREPREGWLPDVYEAALQRYFEVRRVYPRTARMHPSTAIAVAPADRVSPVWWPVSEVRRHYAPARIILSDDAPLLLEWPVGVAAPVAADDGTCVTGPSCAHALSPCCWSVWLSPCS